ncbi:hypothetical protein N7495_009332 [Penicillium taxi]|uniref:uncharacterized protein n=1 Tax=Penicillium taxi TaxID=168475 RepID=UPI0025450DE6|nr:uncharacterized protein N7495_009332 [Penicillium taxi]KAJ5884822.1 hypothetical protein N7495_009332 [Penicillium taxi]
MPTESLDSQSLSILSASQKIIVSPDASSGSRKRLVKNGTEIVVISRNPFPNAWIKPRVKVLAIGFLDPVESITAMPKEYCSDVTYAFSSHVTSTTTTSRS